MAELSVVSRQLLEALIGGPKAWQTPDAVAEALGLGVEETTDLLCELDMAGWLVVWDGEDAPGRCEGPVVCLSPLGAERLGVRLVEVGPKAVPAWARLGDVDPLPPRGPLDAQRVRPLNLERAPDPFPGPEQAAILAERSAAQFAAQERLGRDERGSFSPPSPSHLIGVGLTPWPGPSQTPGPDRKGICPACGGRPLRSHMYCLCCDNWGFDGVVDRPGPTDSPSPRPPADAPDPGQTREQAERLREVRKAKRLRSHLSRSEADRRRARHKPNADRPAAD